jgi:hypothetical protein
MECKSSEMREAGFKYVRFAAKNRFCDEWFLLTIDTSKSISTANEWMVAIGQVTKLA